MPGPWALFPTIDSTALAQQTSGRRPIAFPTTIQWNKQRGVTKYRLQIAEDEKFSNVFYDGPVIGERYMVTRLAPGYYYWRIAPAGSQTGAFSKPVRFFVSGGVVVSGMPPGSPGTRPRLPAVPTPKVR
ncbi:MAG: hypothetical protein M3R52_02545 [Acidobacteriota bacterium]|nr:hypothetical protein [Acidobacteriota bacterium]